MYTQTYIFKILSFLACLLDFPLGICTVMKWKLARLNYPMRWLCLLCHCDSVIRLTLWKMRGYGSCSRGSQARAKFGSSTVRSAFPLSTWWVWFALENLVKEVQHSQLPLAWDSWPIVCPGGLSGRGLTLGRLLYSQYYRWLILILILRDACNATKIND